MGTLIRSVKLPSSDVTLPSTALNGLISHIGCDGFDDHVIGIVGEELGADICGAYAMGRRSLSCLFARASDQVEAVHTAASRYTRRYWQSDPLWSAVCENPARSAVFAIDIDEIPNLSYRRECFDICDIVDKMSFVRAQHDCLISLNVFRRSHSCAFTDGDISRFATMGDVLVNAIVRHNEIASVYGTRIPSRLSIDRARELLVEVHAGLTRRELDVCSRALAGLTSEGIALDLGISTHTVTTYRKRAYARLGISSHAELFALCLGTRDAKPSVH